MRAADGTILHTATGKTIVVGDKSKNYRADCQNGNMSEFFVHSGAEYLLYLNGQTGEPYQIGPSEHPNYMSYPLKRLEDGETDLKKAWGDGYGHRMVTAVRRTSLAPLISTVISPVSSSHVVSTPATR